MTKYLVVGSGLFGSVFAHEAAKRGHSVHVIEKRQHIGGNVYTEEVSGIQVHKYGAHIFHTKSKKIWEYVQQFGEFNNFVNSPIANYYGKIFNLPFNMNTFNEMWNTATPDEARSKIEEQKREFGKYNPQNVEEQAISLVGKDIYETLIKGYTEKQWGRRARELPAFIIRRIPVRFTYDNNYFDDLYQGIPIKGYTALIRRMLDNPLISVETGADYFSKSQSFLDQFDKTVYTGAIDEFFDYKLGELEYRSLRFETKLLDIDNYQGNAVVNYTDRKTPFTRIIEHKHFNPSKNQRGKTVVTWEYPQKWFKGQEPYYPINDRKNNQLYKAYTKLAKKTDIVFGGRLGMYRYYNMDQVIMAALRAVITEFGS